MSQYSLLEYFDALTIRKDYFMKMKFRMFDTSAVFAYTED